MAECRAPSFGVAAEMASGSDATRREEWVMRLKILNDKSGPIAFWAFWALCVLGAAVFWLVVASVASAQSVGPACTASWTAPTTNADGSPISGALSYRVYVDKSPVTPNVTVPTATVTTPSWACGTLTAGSHTVTVSAFYTGVANSEGAATSPLAFVLILGVPGSPSGLKVQ